MLLVILMESHAIPESKIGSNRGNDMTTKRRITIEEVRDEPGCPGEYRVKIESGRSFVDDYEEAIPIWPVFKTSPGFVAGGLATLLQRWLNRQDPCSLEEMRVAA